MFTPTTPGTPAGPPAGRPVRHLARIPGCGTPMRGATKTHRTNSSYPKNPGPSGGCVLRRVRKFCGEGGVSLRVPWRARSDS